MTSSNELNCLLLVRFKGLSQPIIWPHPTFSSAASDSISSSSLPRRPSCHFQPCLSHVLTADPRIRWTIRWKMFFWLACLKEYFLQFCAKCFRFSPSLFFSLKQETRNESSEMTHPIKLYRLLGKWRVREWFTFFCCSGGEKKDFVSWEIISWVL